jgi:hypothetical protein
MSLPFTVYCLPNALPYAPSSWHDGVSKSRMGLYQTVLVSSSAKISYIARTANPAIHETSGPDSLSNWLILVAADRIFTP